MFSSAEQQTADQIVFTPSSAPPSVSLGFSPARSLTSVVILYHHSGTLPHHTTAHHRPNVVARNWGDRRASTHTRDPHARSLCSIALVSSVMPSRLALSLRWHTLEGQWPFPQIQCGSSGFSPEFTQNVPQTQFIYHMNQQLMASTHRSHQNIRTRSSKPKIFLLRNTFPLQNLRQRLKVNILSLWRGVP